MLSRTRISELANKLEQEVRINGWVKRLRRVGKKLLFMEVADDTGHVQLVFYGAHLPAKCPLESAIAAWGKVVEQDGRVEIQVSSFEILSAAIEELPFVVNTERIDANIKQILDYRSFSLRNAYVRSIFKIQGGILKAYRAFLRSQGFNEIKTPKLVAGATESGASVFKIDYFGQAACLAQSPQFYKQMMVGSGLERVFEVGPVFRAESHNTARHINEYTSLDVEMGFIESIEDLMTLEENLLNYILITLNQDFAAELKLLNVYPLPVLKIPRLTLAEARNILIAEYGHVMEALDIDPQGEKLICQYVEAKYGSRAVFLTEYPLDVRPFYTMPHRTIPGVTNSFDLIFKGVEITTGGQRIHQYDLLLERALAAQIDPASIESYLAVFKLGMPPHGGFAIGLERLTAQLLGIDNIKMATLFPRDQQRLTP